jgi:hypothetical protein
MNIQLKVRGLLSKKLDPLFEKVLVINETNFEIAAFCDYSFFNIPLNHNFKRISDSNGSEIYNGSYILKKVTQAFLVEYDSIPKGHKSICKFQFIDKHGLNY